MPNKKPTKECTVNHPHRHFGMTCGKEDKNIHLYKDMKPYKEPMDDWIVRFEDIEVFYGTSDESCELNLEKAEKKAIISFIYEEKEKSFREGFSLGEHAGIESVLLSDAARAAYEEGKKESVQQALSAREEALVKKVKRHSHMAEFAMTGNVIKSKKVIEVDEVIALIKG